MQIFPEEKFKVQALYCFPGWKHTFRREREKRNEKENQIKNIINNKRSLKLNVNSET